VVLVKTSGQTSNQLWQNLWLESFLFDHDIAFENPALGESASVWGAPWPWTQRLRAFVLFVLWRLKWLPVYRLHDETQVDAYRKALVEDPYRVRYVEGWAFRSPETVEKYASYWRKKYEPRFPSAVLERLGAEVHGFDVVLGVHMRRRDYKTWMGGRYLFSQAQYRAWTDQFVALHPGVKLKVLLFSEEPVDQELFSSLTVPWYASTGTVAEDYWLMTRCHVLLGPPSTFTLWASFLGKNTCVHLESAEDSVADALTHRVKSPYYG